MFCHYVTIPSWILSLTMSWYWYLLLMLTSLPYHLQKTKKSMLGISLRLLSFKHQPVLFSILQEQNQRCIFCSCAKTVNHRKSLWHTLTQIPVDSSSKFPADSFYTINYCHWTSCNFVGSNWDFSLLAEICILSEGRMENGKEPATARKGVWESRLQCTMYNETTTGS